MNLSAQNQETEPDQEVQNVMAALQRASQRARIIAVQTHTAIIVMRNGELITETPYDKKQHDISQSKKTI